MNTIIGASLTTRTDGLGTARYSDPVSGGGSGGGSQGPQGLMGEQGEQGEQGFQGPSGGGGGAQGMQGHQPVIDSQQGTQGVQEPALRFDTIPGLLLVGNPDMAVDDTTLYASLEFVKKIDNTRLGERVRIAAPYEAPPVSDYSPTLEAISDGWGAIDAKGGLQVKLADRGLRRTPDGVDLPDASAGDVLYYDGAKWVILGPDPGKFLESGPADVSWGTPAGGTPGNTPPIILDETGAHPEGTPIKFMRDDTVGGLKLVGSPGLFTETGGDLNPTLEAVTVGAVKQGFRARLAALDYGYEEAKIYGLLKAVPTGGAGVTKDGLAVLVNYANSGGIVAGADGLEVSLDPDTSGLYVVDNFLTVKVEPPGPGAGGIMVNGVGELYTVWQADPV